MEDLRKKKKVELTEICRARNLPVTGTKDVLIARILGEAPQPAKTKAKKSHVKTAARENTAAVKVAMCNRPVCVISKNSLGNFEHKETGFVFEKESKRVIGKQEADQISQLSIADVQVCKELGFSVDETRVSHEISEERGSRFEELEKYMDDLASDDEDE